MTRHRRLLAALAAGAALALATLGAGAASADQHPTRDAGDTGDAAHAGDAAVPAVAAAGPTPVARAAYATIEGTGSTWSELIVKQWIADVDAIGIKVVYTGGGSSKGRKDFAQNTTDFAISEIPYQGRDEAGQADTSNGRDFSYLPIVAGGTAFTYQLKVGDDLVRNLRLSGETIAKIFTGQITNWNDAQITADNNGRSFPDKTIVPVVRSDGSGTTAQLTSWLDAAYPSIWRPYFGRAGLTSYYPRKGDTMIAQAGSDQVMNTVSGFAGDGTIGYVEYSYPIDKDYPVVKVLNRAGYYVEPTQYNTAVALTKARINRDRSDPTRYLTQILDGVYNNPDPRAYPISSYSYMIIPTAADDRRMTTAKRQSLADFLYYSLCSGQTKAGPYGYSPLTLNLVEAGFEQVAQLKKADPAVDLTDRDVRSCNNPTFDGKDPSRNRLAEIAAMPPACDRQGEGPCGGDTGQNVNNDGSTDPGTTDPSDPGTTDPGTTDPGSTDPGTGPGGVDPGTTGPDGVVPPPGSTGPGGTDPTTDGTRPGAPVVSTDPETGEQVLVGAETTSGLDDPAAEAIFANAQTLDERPPDSRTFGMVAVLELLALVLLPGAFLAFYRRRGVGPRTRS
ncbi:hypothetical protein GCM10023340_37130 [Nocardioides marinquilinus]|uniref:PBP domain-containing protein n=1 Tax=Nocardioides marinquilinus TaxID=1210400 RepID=A0ABP9Q3F2_9ACTN